MERASDEGFRDDRAVLRAPRDATSLTDDSAPAGSTCYYRVRAEGETGYSPWSAPVEFAVP